jgi:peptidoglycan/LPS O-acetylase OafA/YrhL
VRFSLFFLHVGVNPYRYYFFPANIVFFLMGCVSYRIYAAVRSTPHIRKCAAISACALLSYLAFLPLWRAPEIDGIWSLGFFLCVFLAIPFLFAATKDSRLDNAIGNLSYPLYILQTTAYLLTGYAGKGHDLGIITVGIDIALAIVSYLFVEKTIERIRQRISGKTKRSCQEDPSVSKGVPLPSGEHSQVA